MGILQDFVSNRQVRRWPVGARLGLLVVALWAAFVLLEIVAHVI